MFFSPADFSIGHCDGQPNQALNDRVHIDRNFIHHNENDKGGSGYGIVMANGATATLLGNTFLMDRHAIASDGENHTQYMAWGNLVLSSVPHSAYSPQQDFDIHSERYNSNFYSWVGGFAGSEVDILWNTFLADNNNNRVNFSLRGAPCKFSSNSNGFMEPMDTFGWNVTMNKNQTVRTSDYCLSKVNPGHGLDVAYNAQAPSWPAPSPTPTPTRRRQRPRVFIPRRCLPGPI